MEIPKTRKTQRVRTKLSIVLQGKGGAGKTFLATKIAHALEPDWNKIAVADSELGGMDFTQGAKYSNGTVIESLTVYPLSEECAPEMYVACRNDARANGATVFINDSVSHAWDGTDGVLDRASKIQHAQDQKKTGLNAWNDPSVKGQKDLLLHVLRDQDMHVISTMRIKDKTTMKDGAVEVVVDSPVFNQQSAEYDPDLILKVIKPGSQDSDAEVVVLKSRYECLRLGCTYKMTDELIADMIAYCNEGADPSDMEEKHKTSLVQSITDICKAETVKATKVKMYMKTHGLADKKLTDLSYMELSNIYNTLQ